MQKSMDQLFDALVAPHLEQLFRIAYRLTRNVPDAQDLVQDTCVAACDGWEALQSTESPLSWLLRVQQNRFIDLHRRKQRSPLAAASQVDDFDGLAGQLPDPESLLQRFESEQLLEHAFLQLDGMQQTLLALRAEGYELPEIEAITGIDRGVLSSRLYRARLRLTHLVNYLHGDAEAIRFMESRK